MNIFDQYKKMKEALEKIANGYLGDQTAEQQFIWAQSVARETLEQLSFKRTRNE